MLKIMLSKKIIDIKLICAVNLNKFLLDLQIELKIPQDLKFFTTNWVENANDQIATTNLHVTKLYSWILLSAK